MFVAVSVSLVGENPDGASLGVVQIVKVSVYLIQSYLNTFVCVTT